MDGRERFLDALKGQPLDPVATGLTYVPPAALEGWAPAFGQAGVMATAASSIGCDFAFVPSEAGWAKEAVSRLASEGVAAVWSVAGPAGGLMALHDAADILRRTFSDPDALEPGLATESERALAVVADGASIGADAIVVGEDLAGSTGPLMDPAYVRERVMPRLAALARVAGELDLPALLHSDGDVGVLLPDIAEAGFAAVHLAGPWEATGFERIFWAARRAGLAVVGGLQTARLARGPAEAVLAGAEAGVLAGTGGLLVADDGGVATEGHARLLAEALASARGRGAR